MKSADCKDATPRGQAILGRPRRTQEPAGFIMYGAFTPDNTGSLMKLTLRDGRATDLDFIIRGNTEMARETEGIELDPALVGPGTLAVLRDRSLGRYFIAEFAGRPIGQLMLTFEWSDWRNGVFWWIQSVYVHPPARQSGVFTALFRHLEAQAKSQPGVCGLRLYVEDGNTRAQLTYRRCGMADGGYRVMEIDYSDAVRPAGE
jgi:ribosomal protein S18 acetylase RimI-like enzyme